MKGYEFVPPKAPRFTDIYQVINVAKENFCWIFHAPTKKWWTPSEFYDEFHEKDFISIFMLDFIEGLSVRDPRSGITAAYRQLTELEVKHKEENKNLIDRIEVFNKKVIEYYQEMSKPRLKKQA